MGSEGFAPALSRGGMEVQQMPQQKIDPMPTGGFSLCDRVPQQHDLIGGMHFHNELVLCIKVNNPGPPHQVRVNMCELVRRDKRGNCWEIRGYAEEYSDRGSKRVLRRCFRAQFLINQKFGWFEYLD